MKKYSEQQIEERKDKLPNTLKDALYSPKIADVLYKIGKKYELTIERIGFLAEEVGYVILGLTKTSEFIDQLSGRLDMDREKISKLAKEVNTEVFLSLRELLKGAGGIAIEDREKLTHEPAEATPPPTRPPMPPKIPPIDLREEGIRKQELGVRPPKSAPLPVTLPTIEKKEERPLVPPKPPTPRTTSPEIAKSAPPSRNATEGRAERTPGGGIFFATTQENSIKGPVSSIKETAEPAPKAPKSKNDPYREPVD